VISLRLLDGFFGLPVNSSKPSKAFFCGSDIASFVAGDAMQFPNLIWAIRRRGPQFEFAAALGESESWLSRRLTGRVEFAPAERVQVARALGYPGEWLFAKPEPPQAFEPPSLATEAVEA